MRAWRAGESHCAGNPKRVSVESSPMLGERSKSPDFGADKQRWWWKRSWGPKIRPLVLISGSYVKIKESQGPHRLVVRTLRCGRDNPGSTPGVVMQVRRTAEIHGTDRMPDTPASMSGVGHAYAFQTGAQSARAAARAHMTSISCPTGSGGLRHSGVPGHQSLLDH